MNIESKRGRKLLMVRTPPVSRHPAYEQVERLFSEYDYACVSQETLAALIRRANDIVASIYRGWNEARPKNKKMDVPCVSDSFPPYTDERGRYGHVSDTDGHVYASLLKIDYADIND